MFVGRTQELEALGTAWEAARRGEPQLAVLLAPPGVGKTRLVQEFYHSLSRSHDGVGQDGYWPDRLGRDRDRISLGCSAEECNAERPMTMMWWAIKCVDSGSNGAASSDLMLAYRDFLEPHLQLRRTDAQLKMLRRKQLGEAAKGLAEAMLAGAEKAAELIPIVGPFVGLGKALGTTIVGKTIRVRQLEAEYDRIESERYDLTAKVQAAQDDFEEQLIAGLGEAAAPTDPDMPRCPLVLVVDDAQFADQEPALASILRRVIDIAWRDKWPLLVILTHWTREWNERTNDIACLPGVIGAAVERGLLQAAILKLGRIDELGDVLRAAIPGLPPEQESALLAKAGGNARYLERLVQLLLASPAMFVEREARGAIHEDALSEIMGESFDLHDVTRRLFDSAPQDARRAAALASMQGDRFLHSVIDAMLAKLGQPPLENGISYCENPLAVIGSSTPGIGEFSQGVFREVARTLVPRLVDREASVLHALEAVLRERLDAWPVAPDARETSSWASDALMLDLVIGIALQDPDWEELGLRAAARKIELLREQGDNAGATAVYAASADMKGRLARKLGTAAARRDHADALRQLGDAMVASTGSRAALPSFRQGAAITEALARDPGDLASRWDHALMLERLGDALFEVDGPRAARPFYEDYERIMAVLTTERGTFGDRRTHAIALSRLGNIALDLEGPAAALPWFETYLAAARSLAEEFDTATARRDLGIAHSKLGAARMRAQGPAAALPHFNAYVDIADALLAGTDGDGERRDLALALEQLGDALFELDGAKRAYPTYARYEELTRQLVSARGGPGDCRLHGLATCRLGNVWRVLEGPRTALPHYQAYVDICEALVRDLDTVAARHDLGIALLKLGDTLQELEGPGAALPLRRTCLKLAERIWQERGTLADRRAYALALTRMGDVTEHLEGPLAALPYHRGYVEACRALIRDTGTPEARRDLCIALGKLGNAVLAVEGPKAAQPYFEEDLQLARALAGEIGTPESCRDVAIALNRMGDLATKIGAFDEARSYFSEYIQLADGLAGDLATPDAEFDSGHARSRMGELLMATGDAAGALPLFQEYARVATELVESRDTPHDRRALEVALNFAGQALLKLDDPRGALDRFREAAGIAARLAAESDHGDYRRDLAISHYLLGEALWQIDGPAAARGEVEAYERVAAALAAAQMTAASLWDHAHALGRLAELNLASGKARMAQSLTGKRVDALAKAAAWRGSDGDWNDYRAAEDRLGAISADLDGDLAKRRHLEARLRRCTWIAEQSGSAAARIYHADTLVLLGDLLLRLQDPYGALAHYRALAAVMEGLADDPSTSMRWKRATAFDRMGEATFRLEGAAQALPYFRRSVEMLEQLMAEAPSDALRGYYEAIRNRYEYITRA